MCLNPKVDLFTPRSVTSMAQIINIKTSQHTKNLTICYSLFSHLFSFFFNMSKKSPASKYKVYSCLWMQCHFFICLNCSVIFQVGFSNSILQWALSSYYTKSQITFYPLTHKKIKYPKHLIQLSLKYSSFARIYLSCHQFNKLYYSYLSQHS